MNELIESMIGKRCVITGDISSSCVGTILAFKENWIEVADDKGEKSLVMPSMSPSSRSILQERKKPNSI